MERWIKNNRAGIQRALAAIPKSIQTRVLLADHRDAVENLTVNGAIGRLDAIEYGGGCDNTSALLAAKKHIGRNIHGAIVWIHGAQSIVFEKDKRH